jgi:small conductance mechanosensitive channel
MITNLDLSFFKPYMSQAEGWWSQALVHLRSQTGLMTELASALGILIITLFVSRWASEGVKRLANRMVHADADRTLPEFLSQVVRWMVLALGFVAILNRLGVETASLITVIGAISLSIGLALQGTLGNVAAGLMMLFTKPYRIGDIIKAGEVTGRVHRLGIFNTEIDNIDGLRVFVPNAKVFSNEIINISTNEQRRIELEVEIGYDADIASALAVLKSVAMAYPLALTTPLPFVGAQAFNASGVLLKVMIWVLPSDWLEARSQLIIAVKAAFDAAGIGIPYPHQVQIEFDKA